MKTLLAVLFGLAAVILPLSAQDIRLRDGDQIQLRLGGVPAEEIEQVTGLYQVDGEGYLNLPHIGRIKASGLTQNEVQKAVEALYKEKGIYTAPTVTINVPMEARFVNVGGEVKAPRRVEFTVDLTVLAAINSAGGFTEFANEGKVRLLRNGEVTTVNVKKARTQPQLDIRLQPGDTLEVPRSFW
jgi:polysaccharide export outer membrane protein